MGSTDCHVCWTICLLSGVMGGSLKVGLLDRAAAISYTHDKFPSSRTSMLRRPSPRRALAALALAIAIPSGAQAPSPSAVGEWLGTLTGGGVPLRVGFSIRARPDGALEADLDSYDQGAMDIPADSARQRGDTVRIWIRRIAGAYQGTLSPDGRTLTG